MMNTEHLDDFKKHLMALKGLKAISVKRYHTHVVEFLDWRAQDGPWSEITRKDAESYLEDCRRRGNGNQTRLAKRSALQSFSRYLVLAGMIPADFTADISRPDPRNDPQLRFSKNEILRLFGAIDISTEKGLRDATFLILGAFGGLRVNEMLNLNVEAVSDNGKYFTVVKSKKYGNRDVWIWSAPSVIVQKLLAARLEQGARKGDPLLVSYWVNGKPRGNRRLNASMLDHLLKKLAERAEIRKPQITTHMLRVRHIFDLRQIFGFDTPRIMRRLGWSSPEPVARHFNYCEEISPEHKSFDLLWWDFINIWIKKEGDGGKQS